jgi:hypothetical protein
MVAVCGLAIGVARAVGSVGCACESVRARERFELPAYARTYLLHDATGGWGAAVEITGVMASSFSLAPIAGGKAVISYLPQPTGSPPMLTPSLMFFDGTSTWSAPVAVAPAGSASTWTTAPAVAQGVCNFDAVVAYQNGSSILVRDIVAGSLGSATIVQGTSTVTEFGIATRP